MKKVFQTLLMLVLIVACAESPVNNDQQMKSINQIFIESGELPEQAQVYSKNEISSKNELKTESNNNYISSSKQFNLTNKFDEIVAFNSAYSDILYPGAIVQGKDLLDGKLTSIGDFAREPITLTMNNLESQKVDNPNLSTISTGITKILEKNKPAPAQMQYSKTELFDSDQAFLDLGLDVNWLSGQLSGKFQKETSVKKKSIFLYFKQIYYTVSASSFTSPADYFKSDIDSTKLKQKVSPGNPACYISSVSYGRIILVKITSEESYESMKSAIEGSYLVVSGKSGFDKSKFKINCTFDAIIVGGSSKGAADAITSGSIDKINELIQKDAEFSSTTPAYPISYTVRYLNGGSPVKLGKTSSYWQQDWQLDPNQYQKFDIVCSGFNIIDDGNSWGVDGKFYYKIQILDKNGLVLKDANGKPAEIIQYRTDYQKYSDGSKIPLTNGTFSGLLIKKINNECFKVKVELWDYFSSGNDIVAGTQGNIYYYPWSTVPTQFYNMDLVPSSGSYQTQFTFRVVKY